MFKAMVNKFKYGRDDPWWTDSSSAARAMFEAILNKFKCKTGSSMAMFKAMVNDFENKRTIPCEQISTQAGLCSRPC